MPKAAKIWTLVTLVMVMAAMAGCGTTGVAAGTPVSMTQADIARLAGTWQGAASMASTQMEHGTLIIRPDGGYEIRAGALVATGTSVVRDGVIYTTNTSTSGLPPEKRTSQAVLTERDGTYVLTGWGNTDRGPFSYIFSRPK